MMLPLREETFTINSRIGSPSRISFLYFTAEFWIAGLIWIIITILNVLRSFLPKPPRDLTGDVVLIAGSSSLLGETLIEEFNKAGCSVICMDKDLSAVERINSRLDSSYPRIEEIKPKHMEYDASSSSRTRAAAYICDLTDREDIRKTARKIKDEVGKIDVVVGCMASGDQDIFTLANNGLMSFYWTVLAFLPSMLNDGKAQIVGVTPVASRDDAYVGSKIAIASLMETLGQELSNRSSDLTFLSLSPVVDRNDSKQSQKKIARDIVDAVRSDHSNLSRNWFTKLLYRISCLVYKGITTVTR